MVRPLPTNLAPLPSMKIKKGGEVHFVTSKDLPAPGTFRWTSWQKAFFSKAIECGLISRDDFLRQYKVALTEEGTPNLDKKPLQSFEELPPPADKPQKVEVGVLAVNLVSKEVRVRGELVRLTSLEYRFLEFLCVRVGTAVKKESLLQHLYGERERPKQKNKDTLVHNLRKRLGEAGEYVQTAWGFGYVLCERKPKGHND